MNRLSIAMMMVAVAAALYAAAMFFTPGAVASGVGLGITLFSMIVVAVLLVGGASVIGFVTLLKGATGRDRVFAIALCVFPAILGGVLALRVYRHLDTATEAMAAVNAAAKHAAKKHASLSPGSSTAGKAPRKKGGPPARRALDVRYAAPKPKLSSTAVVRATFATKISASRDDDKMNDEAGKQSFTKGTWFFARAKGVPVIVTAGHLFGPFSKLGGRFEKKLSSQERAALLGDIRFGSNPGAKKFMAKGMTLSPGAGDVAAFLLSRTSLDSSPTSLASLAYGNLELGKRPPVGAPVWLATLIEDEVRLQSGVVAANAPMIVAYLDDGGVALEGVSGAPLVDKDGRVVAVFVGKSNVGDAIVVVGTPIDGVFTSP